MASPVRNRALRAAAGGGIDIGAVTAKALTEQKNLSIVAGVEPDVPIVQTDPAKLQQVIGALGDLLAHLGQLGGFGRVSGLHTS